jgi:branched-chain amino acid aminotransferase
MKINVEPLDSLELKSLFTDPDELGFGKVFTDRLFIATYRQGTGWSDARIAKYDSFSMDPAAVVLHYGQEIFEGLKGYAAEDGRILLFRPEQNARRLNRSAERMCMPTIPEADFLQAVKELVVLEKRWIPRTPGTSLYIRPTMIGSQAALGVHPSSEYLFYIILSPSGPYFKGGFKPVSLYVEETFVRAAVGGTGEAKTGANYAASLLAAARAEPMPRKTPLAIRLVSREGIICARLEPSKAIARLSSSSPR